MSTQKIFIKKIDEIKLHTNADKLELAIIGGWQTIVGKGQHNVGDLVAYVEINTCLPLDIAEKYGVAPYMKVKTDKNNQKVLMVQQVKLRGEPSFGLCLPTPEGCIEGDDVTEFYGAFKFEPPVKTMRVGEHLQQERDYGSFFKYTDIENLRTYKNVFTADDIVVYLTKIHGSNIRYGLIKNDDGIFTEMVGSRRVNIREDADNPFWKAIRSEERLTEMLYDLSGMGENPSEVILYGEITHTQKGFDYGTSEPAIFIFDISINGTYLDWQKVKMICQIYMVNTPYEVYRGPFDFGKIQELDATNKYSIYSANHIEEGIVIKPLHKEEHNPKIGRKILKYVYTQYLMSKSAIDNDTTDV